MALTPVGSAELSEIHQDAPLKDTAGVLPSKGWKARNPQNFFTHECNKSIQGAPDEINKTTRIIVPAHLPVRIWKPDRRGTERSVDVVLRQPSERFWQNSTQSTTDQSGVYRSERGGTD